MDIEQDYDDYMSEVYVEKFGDNFYDLPESTQKLLIEANEKYERTDMHFSWCNTFHELIMSYYINYEPSKRGNVLQKFIIEHLDDGVIPISAKNDRGDFCLNLGWFGHNNICSIHRLLTREDICNHFKKFKRFTEIKKNFMIRLFEVYSKFFELKTSYLSRDGFYTIGNIREYQQYDFLVLLLVDCQDNFNYKFLNIPKSELSNIKMADMYGTKKSNEGSKNVHQSFSIKKGSEFERHLIDKWLVEDGFDGLKRFCFDFILELYENPKVLTKDEFNYIVNHEIKHLLKLFGLSECSEYDYPPIC